MDEDSKDKLINNLQENLQMLRIRLNLTQGELAELTGVVRQTIMNFETGKSKMTWNNFLALVFLFTKNEGTDKLLNILEIYTDEFNDYIKRRFIMENKKGFNSYIPGKEISDSGYYEGEQKDGKLHGKGIFKASNGDVYEGCFVDGAYQGKGKYTHADGTVYDGEWKANRHHGFGILRKPNGEVYEGCWENGMRNGRGKQIYEDGRVFDGEWKNGAPINS